MGFGPYQNEMFRQKWKAGSGWRLLQVLAGWLLRNSYLIALGVIFEITGWFWASEGFWAGFHFGGYFVPVVGMLVIISAQMDLLAVIREGKNIDIRARGVDFVHWALDTFLQVGRFMAGGLTILAFSLKVVLLGIIGTQIGIAVRRSYRPTVNEKIAAVTGLVLAVILGLAIGYIRYADPSRFGWGWALETFSGTAATALVFGFIKADVAKMKDTFMRGKQAQYPRSWFMKGIGNNLLVVWFLVHQLIMSPGSLGEKFLDNAGVTFIVVVGNLLYFWYYAMYEYYRARQI